MYNYTRSGRLTGSEVEQSQWPFWGTEAEEFTRMALLRASQG